MSKIKYPIGGFAPGHYNNKCCTCKEDFMGDKYARQCEPCGINSVNESNTIALARLHKLEKGLKEIDDILGGERIKKILGK